MKTYLTLFKLSTFLYIREPQGQGEGRAKDKPAGLLPACFVCLFLFLLGQRKSLMCKPLLGLVNVRQNLQVEEESKAKSIQKKIYLL